MHGDFTTKIVIACIIGFSIIVLALVVFQVVMGSFK